MKKLIVLSFLLFTCIIFSQEKKVTLESNSNFESIEISVDSLEEIDNIKWEDFKDVFKENNPESKISMKVTVKSINQENGITNFSIGVNGKSKEIDRLLELLKKRVLKMKQLTQNFNHKNKK